MPIQVEVVSPERILYSGEADIVICRTTDGEIAFLASHAPFIGALGIGRVEIHPTGGGAHERVAVHGGFVEVSKNLVTILSDVAELASQIDVRRAEEARQRAEAALAREHDDEILAALRRAEVRLELARTS